MFIKFLKGTEHYHCGNEKCFRTDALFLQRYDAGGKSTGMQMKGTWYSEAHHKHPKRFEDEEAKRGKITEGMAVIS